MNTLEKAREIEEALETELESLTALVQTPEVARRVTVVRARLKRLKEPAQLRAYNPTGWYISGEI